MDIQVPKDPTEVRLEVTCMGAPTQVEGYAYNHYVYFRERYGHWTFSSRSLDDFNYDSSGTEQHAASPCPELMGTSDALKLTEALIDIYVKPVYEEEENRKKHRDGW